MAKAQTDAARSVCCVANATPQSPHIAYLGLGSNQGNRQENLRQALRLIAERAGDVLQVSSFIETEPWGYASDNPYLNAAARITTTLSPEQLLDETQDIERRLGRSRKTVDGQYADRTIDIDILLYDDITVNSPRLVIPHPHMLQREFVMQPLREVMPPEDYEALTR